MTTPDLLTRVQRHHRCPSPCDLPECEGCAEEGEPVRVNVERAQKAARSLITSLYALGRDTLSSDVLDDMADLSAELLLPTCLHCDNVLSADGSCLGCCEQDDAELVEPEPDEPVPAFADETPECATT